MQTPHAVKELLPGTEVLARGLRWEVVSTESLGPETLFRLRGLENAVLGKEFDVLSPFETIEPVQHELRPDRAAPLANWLVYHQAFLLEQALGPREGRCWRSSPGVSESNRTNSFRSSERSAGPEFD